MTESTERRGLLAMDVCAISVYPALIVGLVDQVYISRIETGRLKNARLDVLKALSKTSGVSVEYLLLGEAGSDTAPVKTNQPIGQFMTTFFMLSPPKQAQVMNFTEFIDKREQNEADSPDKPE